MFSTYRLPLTAIGHRGGHGPIGRDPLTDNPADGTTGGGGGGGAGTSSGDDSGGKATPTTGPSHTPTPTIRGDFDSDRAARDLGKARDDAKQARDRAAAAEKGRQDLIDSIGVALGLKPDPKTDPAVLATQATKALADTNTQLTEMRIENALLRLAGKAGADPDALRDSRAFLHQVADLDTTATDFEDKVLTAIKDAVKTNPKLAATTASAASQGPGRQGTDVTGSGTPGGRQRSAGLGAAISAAYQRR